MPGPAGGLAGGRDRGGGQGRGVGRGLPARDKAQPDEVSVPRQSSCFPLISATNTESLPRPHRAFWIFCSPFRLCPELRVVGPEWTQRRYICFVLTSGHVRGAPPAAAAAPEAAWVKLGRGRGVRVGGGAVSGGRAVPRGRWQRGQSPRVTV